MSPGRSGLSAGVSRWQCWSLRATTVCPAGIGHPCTTFDKWQMLVLVDEDYRITEALKTFF